MLVVLVRSFFCSCINCFLKVRYKYMHSDSLLSYHPKFVGTSSQMSVVASAILFNAAIVVEEEVEVETQSVMAAVGMGAMIAPTGKLVLQYVLYNLYFITLILVHILCLYIFKGGVMKANPIAMFALVLGLVIVQEEAVAVAVVGWTSEIRGLA